MKIDLSDLKCATKLCHIFTLEEGRTTVECFNEKTISTPEYTYNLNGFRIGPCLLYPTCFHSIDECIEYFQSVKKEMEEASKPKKRYWLWSTKNKGFCSGDWIKQLKYYDDNGYTTTGHLSEIWDKLEKIKHENEFIDV